MHCTNFSEVERWFKHITKQDFFVKRINRTKVKNICTESPTVELERTVRDWLEGGEWTTFWHMKQLMLTLKQNDVRVPIVLTRPEDIDELESLYYHVDPGGSRMIVLCYLNPNSKIDVDFVWPKQHIGETDQLGEGIVIQNAEQLLKPYEDIGLSYEMLLCDDEPCATCEKHNKIHNNPFRFVVKWNKDWFYKESTQGFNKWYEKNKDTVVNDIMDWYTT